MQAPVVGVGAFLVDQRGDVREVPAVAALASSMALTSVIGPSRTGTSSNSIVRGSSSSPCGLVRRIYHGSLKLGWEGEGLVQSRPMNFYWYFEEDTHPFLLTQCADKGRLTTSRTSRWTSVPPAPRMNLKGQPDGQGETTFACVDNN